MYSHYLLWFWVAPRIPPILLRMEFCEMFWAHCTPVPPEVKQYRYVVLIIVGLVVSLNFPWRNRDTHGHTQEMFVAVLLHRTVPTCRYTYTFLFWVEKSQSKQACKFGKTEGQIVLATGFGCQLDTRLMASSETDPTNMFLPRIYYYILEIGRVNPN